MSNNAMVANEWKWWVGPDEELYTTPCESREEAMKIVNREGYDTAYICEAIKEPTKLSAFFDAMQFNEGAEEQAYDELSGPYGDQMFAMTIGQEADLQVMVRATIDVWQEKHGLEFLPFMFSDMRNEECVESDRHKTLLDKNNM